MIRNIKEIFKKLELGVIELILGLLMLVGIIGYFAGIPADLDWIDHTVSFFLFTYLFYKLNITSIMFGKTSKLANLAIIISYFSLFFKDIISYTKLDAFKFKLITFVDYIYVFFRDNLFITNVITFHIGVIGILAASIYIAQRIDIYHPSFFYAVHPRPIKNKLIKASLIFIFLLGFYYFIYNTILEWLEFTIDDPVVLTGVIFYIGRIAKHHEKFHKDDFIFKIGEFSETLYKRFVSFFHYKKTIPLAISGLLVLHALSDLGVFAYSFVFLKENFYLEHLSEEHSPFITLFLRDIENIQNPIIILFLFAGYFLNILSLIIFLLIPIIVWISMFSHKEFHFNRIFLFFIYSSAAAYLLLPAYVIKPLSESSINGADIISMSLLESRSFINVFFPDKTTVLILVPLISILFGMIIYFLSSNFKVKRELYAISIIGGILFYAIYLYHFSTSLISYFYENIMGKILTPYFLIGITFTIFLVLSVIFYVGGYMMFLYEIIMEYHKRKWSEPIDEELVAVIRKIRSIEKKIIKVKKSN